MRGSLIRTAALFISFSSLSFPHAMALPPYNWTNHPDIKRTGVGPHELIMIETNGTLFNVPAAYLEFWPTKDMVGHVNHTDWLNVIFWVHDKSPYPFKWWPPRLEYRSIGDERQEETIFNVVVKNLRFKARGPEFISPSKQFDNARSSSGGEGLELFENRHGLTYYRFSKYPALLAEGYVKLEGPEPRLKLRCLGKGDPATLNCDGFVHYTDLDLAFYVRFPRLALPHWAEIVSSVRDLAIEWRVSD